MRKSKRTDGLDDAQLSELSSTEDMVEEQYMKREETTRI